MYTHVRVVYSLQHDIWFSYALFVLVMPFLIMTTVVVCVATAKLKKPYGFLKYAPPNHEHLYELRNGMTSLHAKSDTSNN